MTDEEKLINKVGKENPFKVPEGYFESFQQQLLSSLPERTAAASPVVRIPLWRKRTFWASAAAMFVGVVVLFSVLRGTGRPDEELYAATDEAELMEESLSDYIATSFIDDYTLYCYLTNDEY